MLISTIYQYAICDIEVVGIIQLCGLWLRADSFRASRAIAATRRKANGQRGCGCPMRQRAKRRNVAACRTMWVRYTLPAMQGSYTLPAMQATCQGAAGGNAAESFDSAGLALRLTHLGRGGNGGCDGTYRGSMVQAPVGMGPIWLKTKRHRALALSCGSNAPQKGRENHVESEPNREAPG